VWEVARVRFRRLFLFPADLAEEHVVPIHLLRVVQEQQIKVLQEAITQAFQVHQAAAADLAPSALTLLPQ
jgi:hypothetical protein